MFSVSLLQSIDCLPAFTHRPTNLTKCYCSSQCPDLDQLRDTCQSGQLQTDPCGVCLQCAPGVGIDNNNRSLNWELHFDWPPSVNTPAISWGGQILTRAQLRITFIFIDYQYPSSSSTERPAEGSLTRPGLVREAWAAWSSTTRGWRPSTTRPGSAWRSRARSVRTWGPACPAGPASWGYPATSSSAPPGRSATRRGGEDSRQVTLTLASSSTREASREPSSPSSPGSCLQPRYKLLKRSSEDKRWFSCNKTFLFPFNYWVFLKEAS